MTGCCLKDTIFVKGWIRRSNRIRKMKISASIKEIFIVTLVKGVEKYPAFT